MMYDVNHYEMMSEAFDEIHRREQTLEDLKQELAALDRAKDIEQKIGFKVADNFERERLQEQIAELYLSVQYGRSLYHEVGDLLHATKLLDVFTHNRVDWKVFNKMYEDTKKDDV